MSKCPCGSNIAFDECCSRYISGSQHAETPEALMRSRYSAYTIADISYIKSTMKGKASENYDEVAAGEWARNIGWLGLTVLKSSIEDDNKGFVEFVARYEHDGNFQKIHENSEFHKVNGLWYYVDGTLYPDNHG